MVQDIFKSFLTRFGIIPQDTPTQSQAQSPTVDLEHPQIEGTSSEGEISDSDQEDPQSGTPELNQLLTAAEEQADYDSFPSPVVTKAPVWKFTEQTSSGSQVQTKSQTATAEAQLVPSTLVKLQVLRYRPQLELSHRLSSSDAASGSSSAC